MAEPCVCVFVSVCACACRGRGRAEKGCNFSLEFSKVGGKPGPDTYSGGRSVPAGPAPPTPGDPAGLESCWQSAGGSPGSGVPAGAAARGAGPGRGSLSRSLSPVTPTCRLAGPPLWGRELLQPVFMSFFFFLKILLGFLCALSASPCPPPAGKRPSPAFQARFRPKSPNAYSEAIDFFRGARGPAAWGVCVPDGHSTGRGTARPPPRSPAELGGAEAAMPPVPRGSGDGGTPGEPCQPRGEELGCALSAPQSASPRPEPGGGDGAALAPPAGTCPRSRAGGGDPGPGPLPRGSGRGGPAPRGLPRPGTSVTPSSPQQLGLMT